MNRSSKTITVIIISAVNNDTFTEGAKRLGGETTQDGGGGVENMITCVKEAMIHIFSHYHFFHILMLKASGMQL